MYIDIRPMFFFKLKYSLAFACVKPCIHSSTESNINKPHVSANREELQQVAKCHTAINTRFTTAQLDWPASKFNRKQRAEYPERTWIFLDFNCQTIWNQFNKNSGSHYLSNLKFIYTNSPTCDFTLQVPVLRLQQQASPASGATKTNHQVIETPS